MPKAYSTFRYSHEFRFPFIHWVIASDPWSSFSMKHLRWNQFDRYLMIARLFVFFNSRFCVQVNRHLNWKFIQFSSYYIESEYFSIHNNSITTHTFTSIQIHYKTENWFHSYFILNWNKELFSSFPLFMFGVNESCFNSIKYDICFCVHETEDYCYFL